MTVEMITNEKKKTQNFLLIFLKLSLIHRSKVVSKREKRIFLRKQPDLLYTHRSYLEGYVQRMENTLEKACNLSTKTIQISNAFLKSSF